MKRKKDSIAPVRARRRCNKEKGKVDEADNHDELCPYFDNLPSHLTAHILLKLHIKSLLICKCVCKIWKTIISEQHFAKLHFERSQVCLMIWTDDDRLVSRTMYHLECEPEKFKIGSNNHVKLDPIFKLPLRGYIKSFREKSDRIKNKSKRPYIACNRDRDHFDIVNSCSGLLCLSEPTTGNPLVICNPITGEFIRLLEATTIRMPNDTAYILNQEAAGCGFYPKTNEYKVINIWKKYARRAICDYACEIERVVIVEIHTLGTPTWRNKWILKFLLLILCIPLV
ncbi:F-box protein [Medicago truncatula]|uniref:F-box protein n=2 Tax=Medicago truncatula TaxID=3880 RepID=G7JW67_MEDTR|nr:F-box protein [Medicago truncatula]